MKEFDFESAKRKFEETILLYKNTNQHIESGFCFKIIPDKEIIYYINDDNDVIKTTTDPLYQEIKNGFYQNKKDPNGYTLITRRPNKTFKIGSNPTTHNFIYLRKKEKDTIATTSNHWYTTQLHKPFQITNDIIENSLSNAGPISNKFWITQSSIYYLTKKIGARKGTHFVINKLFQPHIQQSLQHFHINLIT